MNQGLARRDRQGFPPWTVARDGRFCHFGSCGPILDCHHTEWHEDLCVPSAWESPLDSRRMACGLAGQIPLLHTHRCIGQMSKLHFASNLFCLFLTQQPRCPYHISVASASQCGLHRSDRMFHRTHAGAYVHVSRILPNDEKTSKELAVFWSKVEFFGLRQAVEDHFPSKIGRKRQFFGQKLNFFAFSQAVEDPPFFFEGAGCEKAGCRHTEIRKTQFIASICTKNSHFSWKKTAKNDRFLVKN